MWPAAETHRFTLFRELFIIVWSFSAYPLTAALKSQHVGPIACRNGVPGFELVTGYAYTTSSDLMRLIPGSLELTQCLTYCQMNNTCKAINYETGLCILLSMGGTQRPEALKPAQFPVFTIYAEKLCLKRYAVNNCNNKAWVYERIIGYKLKSESKKTATASTRERCAEMCLRETDFDCRAVNYNVVTGECVLLDHDRHSFSNLLLDDIETGLQADPNFDYLENNCIHDPSKVCEFKKINGLILKTVDSIHPDITSIEDCKKKCLTSPYRCHSFDFGDGTSNVCRTSHLNRASAVHIQDPYLEVSGAASYELDNCYNVSLHCGARGMRVKIKMDKPFTGKIYATSKPNSCYNLIKHQYDFDISMPYNDINCGIMQTSQGRYSNSIVIQHHELIVTSNDIGLSINCQYDLSTKKIAHNILLTDMGDNLNEYITRNDSNRPPIQETPVTSPTVTMRITDRDGNDIKSAEIGDFLSLRFEIPDDSSPYEIFVREVIADDGVDTSEFTLIDEKGCPTDISIMSGVRKVKGHQKSVEAPFEAFKFPTSGIVQFRALVVPCLPTCEPVVCSSSSFDGTRKRISSLGRRRRDAIQLSPHSLASSNSLHNTTRSSMDNELIVIQALEIVDKFPGKKQKKKVGKEATKIILSPDHRPSRHQESRAATHEAARALDTNVDENFRDACMDINNLVILCLIFLIIQFVIITVWGYIKYRHHHLSLPHQYFAKGKIISNPSPISASSRSQLQKISPDRPIDRSFLSLEDINILV